MENKCNHCGKEVRENAFICPYCGKQITHERKKSKIRPGYDVPPSFNCWALIGFIAALFSFLPGIIFCSIGLYKAPKHGGSGTLLSLLGFAAAVIGFAVQLVTKDVNISGGFLCVNFI